MKQSDRDFIRLTIVDTLAELDDKGSAELERTRNLRQNLRLALKMLLDEP